MDIFPELQVMVLKSANSNIALKWLKIKGSGELTMHKVNIIIPCQSYYMYSESTSLRKER